MDKSGAEKTISRKLTRKTYFSHFDLKSGKQTENAELHNRSLYVSEVSSYCCWRSIPAILCVPFSKAFRLSICLKVMLSVKVLRHIYDCILCLLLGIPTQHLPKLQE